MNTTSNYYCRREMTPHIPVALSPEHIPPTLGEAYAQARKAACDGSPVAAWKLGGTTSATRKFFHVDHIYFGMLFASEVFTDLASSRALPLYERKGEIELALRLHQSFPQNPSKEFIDSASYAELFDQWCWAIEMPSSPIINLQQCGIHALIADRCAAGALILGKAEPYKKHCLDDFHFSKISVSFGKKSFIHSGLHTLLFTPEECARRFLFEAVKYDFHIFSGQWISTGGLTECFSL